MDKMVATDRTAVMALMVSTVQMDRMVPMGKMEQMELVETTARTETMDPVL